jgi:23S rRNA (uracil1939-C5)-methyltransferase
MVERFIISHIGHRGDGVAETPDGPVFVPYTLPGETIEADRTAPDRAQLLRIDTPSPDRIAPFCPHFSVCGGCAIQHWAPERYRDWKRDLVVTALSQAGIDAPVGDLIDAHGEGRRRAVFHARSHGRGVLEVGFSALRAHQIVPIDHCPILAPGLAGALKAAWAIAELLASTKKPLDIQTTATDGGIDVDVRGSGALSPSLTAKLAGLAEQHKLSRLTRHGELVIQRNPPQLRMGRASVTLPPGSFLQATVAGEEALAHLVCDYAGKAKSVADLFCGVGPFALRLAETAQVMAVDSDDGAVAALARTASTPGLKPIRIEKRDLFRRPFLPLELKNFDAVVFDPPRQGADAQARALVDSKVPVVIAVSCNAATFARDARILLDGGYRLAAVTPVDQFRHAAHVEIVARFAR